MPQCRHAFIVSAIVLTICGPSFAQTTVDCENPAQASAFAADFRARLKSAQQDAKTKEQTRQQAYAALTKRAVDAGMWNQQEADAFRLQAAASNPALQELDTKRAAAAKEVGMSQYSMLAAESIGSVDPQAGKRLTCILGQKALGYLTAEDEAASAAAVLVTAQLTEEARKKGVAGF